VFIEAPTELQQMGIKIPQGHLNACNKGGIPTTGNAMGRSGNSWLDLSGSPMVGALYDWGALVNPPRKGSDPVMPSWKRNRLDRFVES
jgi:iron transport multicopper oxidase